MKIKAAFGITVVFSLITVNFALLFSTLLVAGMVVKASDIR